VRDEKGSIPFELQVEKGSIDGIKYVDTKVRFFLPGMFQVLRPSAEDYVGASRPNPSIRNGKLSQSYCIQLQARYDPIFLRLGNVVLILAQTWSGSSDPEGLLTFKFDKSSSSWDNEVYMGVIQKLLEFVVKDGKSILECVCLGQVISQTDIVIQRTGSKSSVGGCHPCQ
jgi:hypothetical protein